jgi:hypothetical protein
MFHARRQLQHLTSLDISWLEQFPSGDDATSPDGSLLVGCCPCLQNLYMARLRESAEHLPALQGLSGLTSLALHADQPSAADGLCHLTALKELWVLDCNLAQGLLMQLTELKQLTRLSYCGSVINEGCEFSSLKLTRKVGRLLLRLSRNLSLAVIVSECFCPPAQQLHMFASIHVWVSPSGMWQHARTVPPILIMHLASCTQ